MKWIEVKMRELGVLSNPNYKIAFMLDSKAMITVFTEQYGVVGIVTSFLCHFIHVIFVLRIVLQL